MKYTRKDIEVVLSPGVINLFESYKQTGNKKEKGGVLLGYRNKKNIRIIRASIPTRYDKSNKFNFTRNKKSAQLFINYEFLNTNGQIIYLGEWHTHPEENPNPSQTDIDMIKIQFEKNEINEDFLIMLIVGIDSNYVSYFDGKKLIPLNRVSE